MWRPIAVGISVGAAAVGFIAVSYIYAKGREKKLTKIVNINMMAEFQRPCVHVKNPDKVEAILSQLISGGKAKLQVITDFDMTLTRFSYNGKRCLSCHGILESSKLLPDSYRREAGVLKNKYYPIEICHEMPAEEKRRYMIEWWTISHSLLASCTLNKSDISEMVRESSAMLRDGCGPFFSNLHKNGVPLLVFSAGVGDILEEILVQNGHSFDNMQVVANYMDFNEEDKMIGFKGHMIHTYNKNPSVLHNTEYFDKIQDRSNVILLGDTLGDLSMADGVKDMQACLKIGFLNDKVSERLEKFKDNYDIVLVEDMTMDIPNAILKKIL